MCAGRVARLAGRRAVHDGVWRHVVRLLSRQSRTDVVTAMRLLDRICRSVEQAKSGRGRQQTIADKHLLGRCEYMKGGGHVSGCSPAKIGTKMMSQTSERQAVQSTVLYTRQPRWHTHLKMLVSKARVHLGKYVVCQPYHERLLTPIRSDGGQIYTRWERGCGSLRCTCP